MEILRAINDLRERYDLAPLGKNTEMMKIARVRAEEIASGT